MGAEVTEGPQPSAACWQCGGIGDDHDDGCSRPTPRDDRPITFALAIPHTPWVPERVESLRSLERSLIIPGRSRQAICQRLFADHEPNKVWAQKLWRWAASTGATHLLQLQDDVVAAPNFWPSLRAIVAAQPTRLIGLHANHPLTPAQFRAGRRWHRDHWLTGPAYVFPVAMLREFLAWCDRNPELVASTNEDSLISYWSQKGGGPPVWHPIPTITDVDAGIPSTYGNDAHHEWSMYRRPQVTWRDAPSLAALEDRSYWVCAEDGAPLLPGPGTQACWFCGTNEGKVTSGATGARICPLCAFQSVGACMGIRVQQ